MNYRVSPEARIDLLAAADFYEERRRGLGDEFAANLESALSRILEAPNRWPEIEAGIRRYRLGRFPYAIIYREVASETLEVIAVFHLRRQPGSWRRDQEI